MGREAIAAEADGASADSAACSDSAAGSDSAAYEGSAPSRASIDDDARPSGGDAPCGDRLFTDDAPDWSLEATLWARGISPVAGVDEAGRGALAGPVVAAVVVLPYGPHPYRDSKTLAPQRREELAQQIREEALAWGIGSACPTEIDELNILRATHLAAARALVQLRRRLVPAGLVTDYLRLDEPLQVLAVPRADSRSLQAAAAGVLAKVERDRLMCELAQHHPAYEFERNKGYGAPAHLAALRLDGPCEVHRMTFRPIRTEGIAEIEATGAPVAGDD